MFSFIKKLFNKKNISKRVLEKIEMTKKFNKKVIKKVKKTGEKII